VATIVVVEDEADIASAVVARLESEGHNVHNVGDGLAAVDLISRTLPDLVVLDLMLPGIDGLEVCRRIQQERSVPVLMLTAKDDETDLLVGLAVGADDYITKPFSMRELVARVQAILRRAARSTDDADRVTLGTITLDASSRRVQRGDELVHLTPTEFDLLAFLARRPGVVFPRETILAEVWGYGDGSGLRTVDSHVRSVRRKLGPDVIRTVHGVGYSGGDG
jgi:DNA-binding response OmpR family regulator